MKRIVVLSLCIMGLLYGCMPVKDAMNPNSRSQVERPKQRPNTNPTPTQKPSTKPADNSKETTNNDVYMQSMQFLKANGSDLTDYCLTWIGVPHKMGGNTHEGVDCSGFVCKVYQDVYGITLPRNSGKMEQQCKLYPNVNMLKQGDLIFFGKDRVNHVAIFIKKDKFVHASTSRGVIVSSLEEKYWKENFRSCGCVSH